MFKNSTISKWFSAMAALERVLWVEILIQVFHNKGTHGMKNGTQPPFWLLLYKYWYAFLSFQITNTSTPMIKVFLQGHRPKTTSFASYLKVNKVHSFNNRNFWPLKAKALKFSNTRNKVEFHNVLTCCSWWWSEISVR